MPSMRPSALDLINATSPRTTPRRRTSAEPTPPTDDDLARFREYTRQQRLKELRERERKQMRLACLHPVELWFIRFVVLALPSLALVASFIPGMYTAAEAMAWIWMVLLFVVTPWFFWRTRNVHGCVIVGSRGPRHDG